MRVGSIPYGKDYGAMQMKSSDCWALPLCARHHRMQHETGNELEFWIRYRINPFELAIQYGKDRDAAG